MTTNSLFAHNGRPSQYIFGIQSLPLLFSGGYTLLWPEGAANLPNSPLQGVSAGTIQAMRYAKFHRCYSLYVHMFIRYSLSSLSLGAFYAIASYQNNIPMMAVSVAGRFLATFVFHRAGGGWQDVAPFEACMGLLTAVGIYWNWRLGHSTRVVKSD